MDRGLTWGVSWDKPAFGVFIPHDKAPATVGNGTMIALAVSSKEEVRDISAWGWFQVLNITPTDPQP